MNNVLNIVNDNQIEILTEIGHGLFEKGYTFNDFINDLRNIKGDDLFIKIKSYGGDLFEALSIYDELKSLDKKVTTIIIGSTASAATIIHAAGDNRLITENSRYRIHLPMITLENANSEEINARLNELKEIDKQIINIYNSISNLDEKALLELLIEDKFLGAKEALELGFCTQVINTNSFNKKVTNMAQDDNTIIEDLKNEIKDLKGKLKNYDEKEKEVEDLKAKLKAKEDKEVENMKNSVKSIIDLALSGKDVTPENRLHFEKIGIEQGLDTLNAVLNTIKPGFDKGKKFDIKNSSTIVMGEKEALDKFKKGELNKSQFNQIVNQSNMY